MGCRIPLGLRKSRGHREFSPKAVLYPQFPLNCSPAQPRAVSCPSGFLGYISCHSYLPLSSQCSSINVILGAHNVTKVEETQQHIPVRRAIPHDDYNSSTKANDIMLLQVRCTNPLGFASFNPGTFASTMISFPFVLPYMNPSVPPGL